ncbi:MAG: AAA family ATPase [Ardenticatenia bacterium]|nr:AAA family ATPase [Ardenticatenia bacterium]
MSVRTPTMTTSTLPEELLEPRSIEETGLSMGFLTDLILKVVYFAGEIIARDIADTVCLPFVGVVDTVLEYLKREELVSITGSTGLGERGFRYTISQKGIQRAREALERNQYVGPAPITLDAYRKVVLRQAPNQHRVGPEDVKRALSHLVIHPTLIDRLGPAVNSGRSLFLYGPPGNGKSTIASAIARMMKGDVYVPHAVEVSGSVIKVFDQVNHKPAEEPARRETTSSLRARRFDRRWVKINRPCIVVGGELTLETLDLIYDPVSKTYEAPFQMKANGGVFMIDDFGRQQVRPQDLLNRWIVPLESRVDFLTLQTGMKIEIPFQVLLVFSTNLDPKDLVDEAFLRRIRHKIEISNPTERQYYEIFRRVCQAKGVEFTPQAVVYLLREYYVKQKRELRSVHPRDIVDQIIDIATYRGVQPKLTKDLIDQACSAYFVEF